MCVCVYVCVCVCVPERESARVRTHAQCFRRLKGSKATRWTVWGRLLGLFYLNIRSLFLVCWVSFALIIVYTYVRVQGQRGGQLGAKATEQEEEDRRAARGGACGVYECV